MLAAADAVAAVDEVAPTAVKAGFAAAAAPGGEGAAAEEPLAAAVAAPSLRADAVDGAKLRRAAGLLAAGPLAAAAGAVATTVAPAPLATSAVTGGGAFAELEIVLSPTAAPGAKLGRDSAVAPGGFTAIELPDANELDEATAMLERRIAAAVDGLKPGATAAVPPGLDEGLDGEPADVEPSPGSFKAAGGPEIDAILNRVIGSSVTTICATGGGGGASAPAEGDDDAGVAPAADDPPTMLERRVDEAEDDDDEDEEDDAAGGAAGAAGWSGFTATVMDDARAPACPPPIAAAPAMDARGKPSVDSSNDGNS